MIPYERGRYGSVKSFHGRYGNKRAAAVRRRLSRQEIRSLFKALREAIPTKYQQRDTSALSELELQQLIGAAFADAGL